MSDSTSIAAVSAGSKRWTWLVGLGLGVAVLGIGVASFVVDRGEEQIEVRAVKVARRGVRSQVLAQGKVRAKRQVEVTSEISGRVTQIFVAAGDAVQVGDPLFALDDEQLQNAKAQLQVALAAARAMESRAQLMAEEARRNLERDEKLFAKAVLPEDGLRASRSRVKLAEADIAQASAARERARLDLLRAEDAWRKARVVAPLAGTIVDVSMEVGQVVAPLSNFSGGGGGLGLGSLSSAPPSQGSIVIADLSELIARLDVDELDVSRVRVEQSVRLVPLSGDSREIAGSITQVGWMGRELGGAVQFAVEAAIHQEDPKNQNKNNSLAVSPPESAPAPSAPPPRLRPGMTVSAEIEVEYLPDALAVPVAAVLEGDGRAQGKPDRVWVIDAALGRSRVTETVVTLGPTDQDVVAILAGLAADQLVVEGPFRALRELQEGDLVRIEETVELPASADATPAAPQ